MKKIFVAMLALAAAACSNEDIVSVNQEAIGFDNAFINNSTRSVVDPSYTVATLPGFGVYGFVSNAVLFNDVEVKQENSAFTYTNTQYWIDGAAYKFAAVAPYHIGWTTATATLADDTITTSLEYTHSTDANSGKDIDLLYAFDEATGAATGNQPVSFDFRHILSKVKFSFKNEYNATNTTIKVSDVKIANAANKATVTLAGTATTWSVQDGEKELTFGNVVADDATSTEALAFAYGATKESYNERLLIPAKRTYNVSFKVTYCVDGADIKTFDYAAQVELDLQPNYAYDVTATIKSGEAIQFTVNTIGGWDTPHDAETTTPTVQ